ncbi:hypothetical protein ACUHMQ_15280 [Chitinimonas sp. PSY-7]|uniref:hypothetical protein n=1 Tax=Chitinimonas sp. PSY-7 TaxID=3459088 RepID=UPI0040400A17
MPSRLILLALLSSTVLAALPDKYSPILYEHLEGKERTRCDKYVDELKIIEKRKAGGRVKPWDRDKMDAKEKQIEKNYDKYCLRLQQQQQQ